MHMRKSIFTKPYQSKWSLVAFLIFVLAPWLLTPVAYAQDSVAAGADLNSATADEVNAVARQLWCPLCSGVRLDSCELKACDQMKDVIAIKLAEGENTESIRTYFVEQYGPQVLGEPPLAGFNGLAWILPFAALIVGGFVLWNTVRRMARTSTVPAADRPAVEQMPDAVKEKLAEELKRYD